MSMKKDIKTLWFGDKTKNTYDAESGNDRLWGFGANDKLTGGAGKDELIGGRGKDVLAGDGTKDGSFQDAFVFGRKSGQDTVTDFQVGKDLLGFAKGAGGIKTAADVLDHAQQKGDNVIIDLGGGNTITLEHVDLGDFKGSPSDHFYLY